MEINLYFKTFFIPKIYINMTLGILQAASIIVPICMGLILIVQFFSTKTNIKYYERHPEQEKAQLRLAEEKENLKMFINKIKKYIVIVIIFLIIAIGLEFVKSFIK